MESNYLPLWKTIESPLASLDESHVELFSLLVLFLLSSMMMWAKKKRQLIRHSVQIASILVFFYIVYSCLGVFGMIRNTLHGLSLIGTVFTESFFWMSLPVVVIAFSLTTGPGFCGWICPTGTFQEAAAALRELYYKHMGSRTPINPHRINRSVGSLISIIIFFIGFAGLIFWLGTAKRFYIEDSSLFWAASLIMLLFLVVSRAADDRKLRSLRTLSFVIIVVSALMKTAIVSPVHFAFADVRDPASALTTLVLVVASGFVSRAWCRYICPWGYLMGAIHRISRLRVKEKTGCTRCGTCDRVCRVEAIRSGCVDLNSCQLCLSCVDHCPEKALELVDVWKKNH